MIALRGNRFCGPAGLVKLLQRHAGTLKLRPGQKIVHMRNWEDEKTRLAGVARRLQALVKLAGGKTPDADATLPPTSELLKSKVARRA